MLTLNVQPAEKVENRPDGALDVFKVFLTIQGEGPFAGVPAVFVRLAGCSLQCPACDTDYTSQRELTQPEELIRQVNNAAVDSKARLIVITGGEPLRQNLRPFIEMALSYGYKVQLETNGLHYQQLPWDPNLSIVCSPKTTQVDGMLAAEVCAWKYVVAAGKVSELDGLPTSALGMVNPPYRPLPTVLKETGAEVYVQPQDDQDPVQNQANLQVAIGSCLKFGYRLSVQIHKSAGLE